MVSTWIHYLKSCYLGGSSRKDSEEIWVDGEKWLFGDAGKGPSRPRGQSVRGSQGGKELVDCGPSQSARGIRERVWEEVRKVVRNHVMGGVWDLLQV